MLQQRMIPWTYHDTVDLAHQLSEAQAASREKDKELDELFPTHGQSNVVRGRDRNTDPIDNTGTFGSDPDSVDADVPSLPVVAQEPARAESGCTSGGPASTLPMWLCLVGALLFTRRRPLSS